MKKCVIGGNSQVIWEPMPIFGHIETVCIVWFTLEYLLRLTVASNRLQFIFAVMNIVDLLAIIPFYLEISLTICGIDFASLSDIKGALLVVRVLRVLRVVRILKLGRYSSGMRTFALTLKSSARQLGMMGMVLSTGVVFFSTLLYFVEKDEAGTPFTSIPAAFWWAIVTMTTVGYGDYVPVTVPGKLIASGAILSGVLVLALPITIIVDNFMKVSGNANPNSMFPTQQPQVSNAYS
uniref:Potassium channel tetramerisation-type BTB domain-containing protein n=1 Tax=Parascaris univalens TaxID=6257 RepID=A0A915AWC3_PARUN